MFYYLLLRIGKVIALLLPLKVAYWLASRCADFCYIGLIEQRKLIKDNLRNALGVDEARIDYYARGAFRNFGKYLVDFFRFSKIDAEYIRRLVEVEGKERLDRASALNKGVIISSAHLGNWELAGAIISLLGYPVNVIALAHSNKRINDFFVKQRTSKGVKVIPVGAAVKKSFDALAENQIVGLLGDRDFSKRGIDIEFFGKDAQFPKGMATFSIKSGSPIVPAFMVREADDTYRLIFEPPIEYRSTGRIGNDLRDIIRRYLEVLESYIERYPSQWFIFDQIWSKGI